MAIEEVLNHSRGGIGLLFRVSGTYRKEGTERRVFKFFGQKSVETCQSNSYDLKLSYKILSNYSEILPNTDSEEYKRLYFYIGQLCEDFIQRMPYFSHIA